MDPAYGGQTTIAIDNAQAQLGYSEGAERGRFWVHLAKAGLITGINPDYITGQTLEWGKQIPAAPMTGAGFFTTSMLSLTSTLYNESAAGNYILLMVDLKANAPLSARNAAIIDRKLDDGMPFTGEVIVPGQGASATTTCISSQVSTAIYNETATTGGCALVFKIEM